MTVPFFIVLSEKTPSPAFGIFEFEIASLFLSLKIVRMEKEKKKTKRKRKKKITINKKNFFIACKESIIRKRWQNKK